MSAIDWHGSGWRLWRVERSHRGVRLRNPWTNTGHKSVWERAEVQVAECIWPRCNGYLSPSCTCGIRSMSTLSHLAAFLASDRQLERHPLKASVVGRVLIGGRVQHRIPGLPAVTGYQRSEFAVIDGPLYVSPVAAEHYDALRHVYDSAQVAPVPPSYVEGSGQQNWIERLAQRVAETGDGIPSFPGRWDPIQPRRRRPVR